jgi:hypothetical protein
MIHKIVYGPCPRCGGKSHFQHGTKRICICGNCTRARESQLRAAAARAIAAVQRAKARGELAYLPDGTPCVDCGAVAMVYDHREYAKPLDVEPVCISCNKLRGPAIDSGALLPHPSEIERSRILANARES